MSKNTVRRAAADGRVAVCPAWLQPGRTVWYWRETLCLEELCSDMVTTRCPLNAGRRPSDPEALICARQHPALESTMIWSVAVYFTPRGPEWSINDLPAVPDDRMRRVFFPDEADARKAKPREVM